MGRSFSRKHGVESSAGGHVRLLADVQFVPATANEQDH